MSVHPSAVIHPGAKLGEGVEIGPFCVIGDEVEIGAGTRIDSHVVIHGPTRIGRDNRIHSFAAIGGEPQDKKFRGERCELVIGDRNLIREFVTINRGTADDAGITSIGDDNWIMAYVHIAHDCRIGNHNTFANAASMAGHVHIGNQVILGGFSLIHQFCKVGDHAFTAMGASVNRDVPPYVMVAGEYAQPRGINAEGLKRRGFSTERIAAIKRGYRTLYMAGLPLAEARAKIADEAQASEDLKLLLDFIDGSTRSLIR
ncbi:acyl-ACP--UDP-N-acetylglucosamine O-acyltransferase [uncultured Aquimonas sp.]|jgi:UDP-N-acetylglucosamine acyltransferase|uniref:acyl-ACP--UDP-N-acetylglucosamine O-acyltransferase n=1 Tax=uncultured Aquimonas sp. TaxID=385483 RepID=UPI00086B1265|nr:acyl-ACP--UDP-N-acetylglucosamine O-acyltransferase [uncultured Aquimonas sp.]ODU48158.1 MAG: acyl-[acyl-carrier-protein]--UDP-N-acetylglucosamine O-acyltransferase [Xanthomonadaceae bacterium SCN 69-123]